MILFDLAPRHLIGNLLKDDVLPPKIPTVLKKKWMAR